MGTTLYRKEPIIVRIIGIDPGPQFSAVVIINEELKIIAKAIGENKWVLHQFDCKNSFLSNKKKESVIAIESIEGFGQSVGQPVFDTIFWSGRFCQAFNSDFYKIGRKAVKSHLCNTTKCNDSAIREAIIYKYGGPKETKKNGKLYGIKSHMWSALAVAITYVENKAVIVSDW